MLQRQLAPQFRYHSPFAVLSHGGDQPRPHSRRWDVFSKTMSLVIHVLLALTTYYYYYTITILYCYYYYYLFDRKSTNSTND